MNAVQAILMAKFALYDNDGDQTLTTDEMVYVVQDLVDPHSRQAKRPHFVLNKNKVLHHTARCRGCACPFCSFL